MNYLQALKILISQKVLQNPKISQLSNGNNYQAFLITDNNTKYVLRLLSSNSSAQDRMAKMFLVLKFVEAEGIEFAEKAVFFDKKNCFLLTHYIPGKELSVFNLDKEQLKYFIKKIAILRNLKLDKFVALQKKEKNIFPILENPIDRLSFLKKKRIKFIKDNMKMLASDDIDILQLTKWIDSNFSLLNDLYKTKKYQVSDIFFDHGDVAGANIILNKSGLFFIDWDNAKFTQDIGFSLANLFFYANIFSSKYIIDFLHLYTQEGKIKASKKELLHDIINGFKLITFSGALWSLESFITSKKNKNNDSQKYLDSYRERAEIYNNFSLQ